MYDCSTGYYADEAAGCQVFHVCHDVLVSSFLCPIGSTFSQKLLTCDWWTKVDCSSTRRYLEVNRDSYQIDDDEMIRNAYAMISLQASAEDVTKDGLVDPDSGTRIIDYSALGDRTVMSYTPGFRRITDYAAVEATGNDLPSGFEDYPQQDARQILNYDHPYQQKANTVYQGKPHFMENKGRSPYHASAIIQHDYQDRSGDNEFQDDYRRPDGFTNQLQTSYAPTVPTVTTTTRRLYSPTVPTTYRPSTLAYSKLDLMVDSSDHLYAHSKSPVTPPTITHQNNDMRKIDLKESETSHDDLKKSENASSSRTNKDDRKGDDPRSKNDEVRLYEETSETNFRINVTDAIDEDEVFRQQNDRPVIQINSEESSEDIETKDSIGIAQALNNPLDRIILQNQNPIYRVSKDERRSWTTPIPLQTILNHSSEFYEKAGDVNSSDTSKKSDETNDNRSMEDYEDISSSTTRSFGDRTTPLLKHWEQKDVDTVQVSTLSMTAIPVINTTETSIDEINGEIAARSSSNDSRISEDQSSSPTGSISRFNDESVHKIDLSFEVPQPAQFLKPPVQHFLINVPEESHYTTIDEKTSWNSEPTTTAPRFSSTLVENNEDQSPIYDEDLVDYTDEGFSETPNPKVYSAQVATEVSTSIPWLVSTWHDRSIVDVPVTDIVPPIIDYNDGFDDFVPPNKSSYTEQFDHIEPVDSQRTLQNSSTTSKKNDSEADILAQYNTGFQFTIRNAVKAQKESKADSRCSSISDNQEGRCETSSVTSKIAVSTPSMKERTVSIISTTMRIPEQLMFSSSTKKLRLPEESVTSVPDQASTSAAKSLVNIEDLNLKTVTPRDVEIKNPGEKTEQIVTMTASSLLHSIRPESLKQIERTIDKHDSPYEVSLTVKEDEDLETTADDFISRLIAQHQRSDSILKELDDFEIVKSVESETEIASILQTPKFSDTSHDSPNNTNNNSFYVAESDTASEFKPSDLSMVSLLQLMVELLKLDRLPRPFSAKELSNAELKDSFNLDLDELSYDTASPLLDQQTKKYKTANSKASTFDTLTPAKLAESKVSRNSQLNKASFTESPLLDHSQAKTPFGGNVDSKRSSLNNTLTTPINIDLKSPLDVSSRVNANNATKQKTSHSKSQNRIIRPLHKEEILEQLTENFGQPLYTHRSLVFDLPQVQRSLDFESGLPLEESKDASSETEEESSISTTTTMTTMTTQGSTTTESVKATVETEFVPSLGFSLDSNEGREEYVQAILGGLIDEHTESGRNKSIAQNKVPKNKTLEAEQ